MDRRTYVQTLGGATTVVGLAGCAGRDTDRNGDTDDDPTPDPDENDDVANALDQPFRIATHRNIEVEDTIWGWIAEQFEEAYPDAEPTWVVPEAGLSHYVERAKRDADVGADVFLGLTPSDLVRIDAELGSGGLFLELDLEYLDHTGRIDERVWVDDPYGRVVPFDLDYVGLAVNETEIDPPSSFEELVTTEYASSTLVQHPRQSRLGEAFLLWTIDRFGPGFSEFWSSLSANDVRIEADRGETHRAFAAGERPITVAYATDTDLFDLDRDEDEPPITYLDGQGYATPGSVAIFTTGANVDLAYRFVDFLLTDPVQRALSDRRVRLPVISFPDVIEDADDDEEDDELEPEPDPEPDPDRDGATDDDIEDDAFENESIVSDGESVDDPDTDTADDDADPDDPEDDPDGDPDDEPDEIGFDRARFEPPQTRVLSYADMDESLSEWLDAWEEAVSE